MSSWIRIESPNGMSDNELKSAVRELPNGGYCESICRGCGCYKTNQNSSTKDALIVDECNRCDEK